MMPKKVPATFYFHIEQEILQNQVSLRKSKNVKCKPHRTNRRELLITFLSGLNPNWNLVPIVVLASVLSNLPHSPVNSIQSKFNTIENTITKAKYRADATTI